MNQDTESPGKRVREESPSDGDPKGKLDIINMLLAGTFSSSIFYFHKHLEIYPSVHGIGVINS